MFDIDIAIDTDATAAPVVSCSTRTSSTRGTLSISACR